MDLLDRLVVVVQMSDRLQQEFLLRVASALGAEFCMHPVLVLLLLLLLLLLWLLLLLVLLIWISKNQAVTKAQLDV